MRGPRRCCSAISRRPRNSRAGRTPGSAPARPPRASPARSWRARRSGASAWSPSSRTKSFSVVTSVRPSRSASRNQARGFGARIAVVIGEAPSHRRLRCRPPPAWQRISPDCRSRQTPAPGRPEMAARSAGSGIEPAVENRKLPRPGRGPDGGGRRLALLPMTRTACARASCASSGARSGPAGKTRPLPMPRVPSTTRIERSLVSDGF